MPCNAKVVVTAKTRIMNISNIVDKAREKNIRMVEAGNSVRLLFGQTVTVDISFTGEVVMRSIEDDWETGVLQLQRVSQWLNSVGIAPLDDVSQPETHRHDEVAPWQRNAIRG